MWCRWNSIEHGHSVHTISSVSIIYDNNDIHDYNASMMMMMMMIVPNTILQDDGDSTVGATVGTNVMMIINSIDVLTSMMMVYLGQR